MRRSSRCADAKRRNARAGALFVEILAAVLVLGLAGVGLVASYLSLHRLVSDGREMQVAVDDMRDMVERIHGTAFNSLATTFPAGVGVYTAVTGPYLLRNQQISIAYPAVTPDKREIVVTLTWQQGNRTRTVSSSTIRTSS
jgi:hypothetical protein